MRSVLRIEFTFVGLVPVENRCSRGRSSPPLFMCCARAANGRLFRANLAAPVLYICTFRTGRRRASFFVCGKPGWPNMTRWKPLRGIGRVSTAQCTKRRLQPNAWVPTPRIGGKNGRKRSLLVDGIGVPLSLVASGANTHDVKLLEATLDQLVIEMPGHAGNYNLCADAGYKGAPASNAVVALLLNPGISAGRLLYGS